jgi:DNA-binding GntR family transcriptional regulator
MTKAPSQGPDPQSGAPYTRLLSGIRAGTLLPGDRLTETDLATRFCTSRTPVREAIRTLEADGLVVHTPRVGATIRTLSYGEITDLYEMRAILEGSAARFAARAAYASETAELVAIKDDMDRARGDAPRLFDLNMRFHAVLLNAARKQFLVRAIQSIQKILLILGPSTLEDAERVNEALNEHKALITALQCHEGDVAEAAHSARLKHLRRKLIT